MNINISKGALASILLTIILGMMTGVATVAFYGGRLVSDVDNLERAMDEQKDDANERWAEQREFNRLVLTRLNDIADSIAALTGKVDRIEGYIEGQKDAEAEANDNPDVGMSTGN